MNDYRLVVDFAAESDEAANRMTEGFGKALESAGARVHAAELRPLSPSPLARLFGRTDRAVPTAAVPLDEDLPRGPGYRGES
jgi:hypothetical protein